MKNKHAFTLTAMLLPVMAGSALAADITFGGAMNITGPSDVSTNGGLEFAYDFATGAEENLNEVTLLNGVPFKNEWVGAGGGPNVQNGVTSFNRLSIVLNNFTAPAGDGFGGTAAGFTSLDSEVQNLLSGSLGFTGSVAAGSEPRLTFRSLTPTETYEIQVFVNRSDAAATDRITFSDAASGSTNSVTLSPNTGNGVGQYFTATFTADAATQELFITSADTVAVNAVQIRRTSELTRGLQFPYGPSQVVWTSSELDSPRKISKMGQGLVAFNLGDTSAANPPESVVINGVTFTAENAVQNETPASYESSVTSSDSMVTFQGWNRGGGNVFIPTGGVGEGAFGRLELGLKNLVSTAKLTVPDFRDPATAFEPTVTFTGLQVGQVYEVQFVAADPRETTPENNRNAIFEAIPGNSIFADLNVDPNNADGGNTTIVTGRFRAIAANQVIRIRNKGQLHAMQLRQLSELAIGPAEVTRTVGNINGETDISTDGTLLEAINFDGEADLEEESVNGVPFAAWNSPRNQAPAIEFGLTSPGGFVQTQGWERGPSGANDLVGYFPDPLSGAVAGLSEPYRVILRKAKWTPGNSPGPVLVTFRNLDPGAEYQFQVFGVDARMGSGARNANFTFDNDGDADSITALDLNTAEEPNIVGGLGQFITGTFTAEATTQTVQVSSSNPQINAMQLRLTRPAPVVMPDRIRISDVSLTGTGASRMLTIAASDLPAGTFILQSAAPSDINDIGPSAFTNVFDADPTASTNGNVSFTIPLPEFEPTFLRVIQQP